MAIPQWQRAAFIVGELERAFRNGNDLSQLSTPIQSAAEKRFGGNCHGCLLLAVYGLYKNGFTQLL